MHCKIRFIVVIGMVLASGCAGPWHARYVDNPLELCENVVIFDSSLRKDVAVAGLKKTTLPNGLLCATVQLQNMTDEPLPLQVKVKFRDAKKFFLDESNWMPVVVSANEIHQVDVCSLTTHASDYVVDVRYAR